MQPFNAFHNPTTETLRFDLGRYIYTVPPGATVQIDAEYSYAAYIKPRQLPLVPGAGPDATLTGSVEPIPPPRQPSQEALRASLRAGRVSADEPTLELNDDGPPTVAPPTRARRR